MTPPPTLQKVYRDIGLLWARLSLFDANLEIELAPFDDLEEGDPVDHRPPVPVGAVDVLEPDAGRPFREGDREGRAPVATRGRAPDLLVPRDRERNAVAGAERRARLTL